MAKKTDSKTTKAVAKKAVTKPAAKKAVTKPAAKKAVTKPVAKKTVAKPVAKKAVTKPIAKKAVAKPVAKKTVDKPIAKKTVDKPIAKKTVDKPIAKKTVAKPVAKKTVDKPIAKKTVAKPVAKKAVAKPIVKKAVAKPIAKKTVAKKSSSKKAKDDGSLKVLINTSHGDIELLLMQDKAPITVINFIKYVKNSHYDGLIFHRVINGFMIQGGGYDTDLNIRDTSPSIRIESDNGLKNERGTIAMARGVEPNSATSQFFINLVDNPGLDYRELEQYGYAVFGKVTKGLDVVDKIGALPTTQRMQHQNIPIDTVVIKTIKLI